MLEKLTKMDVHPLGNKYSVVFVIYAMRGPLPDILTTSSRRIKYDILSLYVQLINSSPATKKKLMRAG